MFSRLDDIVLIASDMIVVDDKSFST